jgi:predicted ATP-grasp superfamily ATP-dependent carboligase
MMMDLMRGRVIVTYGRSLMALAIAESLGRRGVEVIGADDVGLTALSFSRFTKATFVHAPAATDPDAFIEDLVAAVLRFKPDDGRPYVLIPCFQETRLIARHAARLSPHITVAAPAFEAIQAVDPKAHLMRSLRDLPIRAPATCTSDEWRASDPACPARFPLMIKPNWGVGGRGVRRVDDAATLETAIGASDGAGGSLLVQDLIAEDDYCLCALFHNGELQASAAYHNLSQYPQVAGAGVLRETVSDAPFLPAVQALFGPLGWTGVGEIDFRWDRITTPWLIEVNPRFWAGVFHTSTSGVDFPWMLYEMAVTGKVSAHSAARLASEPGSVISICSVRSWRSRDLMTCSQPPKTPGSRLLIGSKGESCARPSITSPSPRPKAWMICPGSRAGCSRSWRRGRGRPTNCSARKTLW